eukprot:3590949-Rhodomonas_salina.1
MAWNAACLNAERRGSLINSRVAFMFHGVCFKDWRRRRLELPRLVSLSYVEQLLDRDRDLEADLDLDQDLLSRLRD